MQWFRNHIYSVIFKEGHFDLITRDMGLEFRYVFGKVLSTQDRPTIRLASHYCVLCLNIIKSKFNTSILTHTHARMHLTYNMVSFIPEHISIHKVIKSQTHMRNPIIYQTKQPPKHGNKHIIMKSWKPLGSTPYKHVYHKRCVFNMTYLYLPCSTSAPMAS